MYFISVPPFLSRTRTARSTIGPQMFSPPCLRPKSARYLLFFGAVVSSARSSANLCVFEIALLRLATTCFLRRLLHLLRADIANMHGHRPLVAKRVFEFAVTIAPEHVLDWHRDLCPRSSGVSDERVNVFDIKMYCDRRAL